MIPESPTLLLFVAAALVLLLTPGPAVFYIVARSVSQGRLAGLVSTLGISTGTIVHVAAAALGLSALLASSAVAFSVVKFLGAAYLVYLGVRTLRRQPQADGAGVVPRQQLGRIYYEGILVNILNPKTALFFFAFLPQFVDPAAGPVAPQIAFLGGLLIVLGLVSDGLYAVLAGTVGQWLGRRPRLQRRQRILAGYTYIVLGVAAAFTSADLSS